MSNITLQHASVIVGVFGRPRFVGGLGMQADR